ncbi:MAG TPA: methionyl-tRNA formyltransferase [Lachnospiraceae bacterium]|nr:methionyl-tRNA formyltransferase [Lachnospiraceae bacterium]
MKIVFMGTPDFAVKILEAILRSPHEVTAVVTQADKPKGRGMELSQTPVKKFAVEAGIPVFQPEKIKAPESVDMLKTFEADIFVVAAFGQILSGEILRMPSHGCINVHASLLPKYRGAAPIQWAIINGEKETGVTIMQMDEGLDTGDMLFKTVVLIDAEETGGSLHDKLAEAGAGLCVEALDRIAEGRIEPVGQEEGVSSYAKMLTKALGFLQFEKKAAELERMVRGLDPWPGTYTYYYGKTLKIWKAKAADETLNGRPGTIARVETDAFYINTGEGLLKIMELQLEGKKRMTAAEFLRGRRLSAGELLCEQPHK